MSKKSDDDEVCKRHSYILVKTVDNRDGTVTDYYECMNTGCNDGYHVTHKI